MADARRVGTAGADTITLTTDVTLTAADNSTYGPTGLPVVTSPITIEGNSHRSAGTSTADFRIMAVGSGGDLTLNSATLSGGVASDSAYPANQRRRHLCHVSGDDSGDATAPSAATRPASAAASLPGRRRCL